MHTQMMEQAAADRVLFLNEDLRSQGANLQFPEYVKPFAVCFCDKYLVRRLRNRLCVDVWTDNVK